MGSFAGSSITRYIPEFAGSQYGTFATPITLAGDFDISVEAAPLDGGVYTLFGQSASGDNYWRLYPSYGVIQLNEFRVRIGGSSIGTNLVGFERGQVHTFRVVRTGSAVSVQVDGVEVKSATNSNTHTLETVGYQQNTNYLNGYLLSMDINSEHAYSFDGVSTTTASDSIGSNDITLTNFTTDHIQQWTYTLDAGGSGAVGWLSQELWTDPPDAVEAPWVHEGSGVYSIDGTQSGVRVISQNSVVAESMQGIIGFTIDTISAGSCFPMVGGANGTLQTDVGTYVQLLTAGSSSLNGISSDASLIGEVSSVTLKTFIEVQP